MTMSDCSLEICACYLSKIRCSLRPKSARFFPYFNRIVFSFGASSSPPPEQILPFVMLKISSHDKIFDFSSLFCLKKDGSFNEFLSMCPYRKVVPATSPVMQCFFQLSLKARHSLQLLAFILFIDFCQNKIDRSSMDRIYWCSAYLVLCRFWCALRHRLTRLICFCIASKARMRQRCPLLVKCCIELVSPAFLAMPIVFDAHMGQRES